MIQLANCDIKAEARKDYIVPRFDDALRMNTYKYEEIIRKEDGTYETTNGEKTVREDVALQIKLDNKRLYFDVPFLVEKDNEDDGGTHTEEEIHKVYVKVENNIYPEKQKNYMETEEIQKINNQIEAYENNLKNLYESGNEINKKIKEMQQSIFLQGEYDSLNQKYVSQNKRFFEKCGIGITLLDKEIKDDDKNFQYDPENLTLKCNNDAEKNGSLNTIEMYLKRLSYDTNLQINELKDSLKGNNSSYEVAMYNEQLALLEEKIQTTIETIKQVAAKLNALENQKETLIEEQKKQVNDLLIDKQGNTLGFDGYGRLILIQDKFENKINVEYGYEKENKGKILSIYSEQQSIKFTYNKETELLESILDPRGRITKYQYDNDQNLNEIIYNDKTKTTIRITSDPNTYIETYEIISPNLRKLIWKADEDGYVTIYKYVYDGTISSNKLDNVQINKLVLKDYYSVYTNPNYIAITDIKGKTIQIYFDNQGREIKYIKDDDIETINYHFDKVLNYVKLKKSNIGETLKDCEVDTSYTIEKIPNDFQGLYFKAHEFDFFSINVDVIISYKDNTTLTINQSMHDLFVFDIVIPLFKNGKEIAKVQFKFSSLKNTISPMDVSLVKLEEATTYTYDALKRLIKEQNKDKIITYSDFNDNDIPLTVKEEDNYNNEVITHYSYNDKNLLTYVEDSKLNVKEYYYDELGNCIEQRSYNKKDASLKHVEKVSYDEKGRPTSSQGLIKDTNGNYPTQEITYLPGTNIESKIKGFNNEVTTYGYDYNTDELISIASSVKGINNSTSFTYNYGLLTSMSHHGVRVDYEYDGQGRKTKISLNGKEYVTIQQGDYDESYETDELIYGTITRVKYKDDIDKDGKDEDVAIIKTIFNNDGNIYEKNIDYSDANGQKHTLITSYIYNEDNRVEYINVYKDNKQIGQEEYTYFEDGTIDEYYRYDGNRNQLLNIYYCLDSSTNLLEHESHYIDGNSDGEIQYHYNEDKNISYIEIKDGKDDLLFRINYDYDALNRVKHQITTLNKIDICHEYSYLQQDENTLDLISEDITKIKIQNEDQTTYLIDTSSYEYDVNGNIVSIDSDDSKTRYEYDELNRLIREDNPLLNQTKVYKYDKAGNIILKKTYDYSLEENLKGEAKVDEYIYDCEKRDQLISYNNQSIQYDTMGRPIVYKGKVYKWNTLNQLEEIPSLNVSYEYDSNGIRNKKTVGTIETTYILEGSKIHQIKTNTYKIILKYALNKVIGFVYNNGNSNKTYIYQRNILGDIIGIFDEEGNQVAKYEYDSYGNCTISKDYKESEIAKINPFRYRGYYYDEETGLYYLNSRYYDPETGRFISPDTLTILDETRSQINGLNLYMYCGDNPITNVDPSGKFFFAAILIGLVAGALVGGTAGGIYAAANGQNFWEGALAGLAIGAMLGLGIGLGVGLIGAALGSSSLILGGLLTTAGVWSIGISAGTGALNLAKFAYSYYIVNKYSDLDYSDIIVDESNGSYSIKTELLKDDKTIMKYVNYMYATDQNIRKNWTKEQLYRELKYHALGRDNFILNWLFKSHLEYVNVESEQTARSYILRYFGNLLW